MTSKFQIPIFAKTKQSIWNRLDCELLLSYFKHTYKINLLNLCHLFQEWHKEQSCCDNNHDDTQDSEEEENIKEGCLISKDIFYLVPSSKK